MSRWKTTAILTACAIACANAAFADVTGSTTLNANTALNLDTGATAASGGDLLWNGTTLTPQGSATAAVLPGLTGATLYGSLTAQLLTGFAVFFSKSAIASSALAPNAIVGVKTNGGNYAKLLVTANSGGSLTIQYTTFTSGSGGGGGNTGPTITAVENAATNIPPGLPNSGIAQGAMMVIKGSGLGPANIAIATTFPLTTTIGGTSVQVTVNGTTVDCIMFYSLDQQVACILPSKTPTGNGTVKVTYNGQSASGSIVVVANNIGIYTLSQTGSGDAVAYLNSNSTLITPTNAANPGDVVIFWGTGLGAVNSDETQPAAQSDLTNVNLQVFIGGKQAKVLFRGRNGCCSSADSIYVTVPDGVSGCAVSVLMQIGNIVSNGTSIAVAPSGRTCTPVSQTTGGSISFSGTHTFGGIALERIVEISPLAGGTVKEDLVGGSFEKISYSGNQQARGSDIDVNSYGSCSVAFAVTGQAPPPSSSSVQFLDAGPSLKVNLPSGTSVDIPKLQAAGLIGYSKTVDQTATTFTAGAYQVSGPGGPDVGAFSATYTMPQPFVWTNQSAITSVVRSSGVTVNWTGGDPNGYVVIAGSSVIPRSNGNPGASASFSCTARDSDLTFTVPAVVLQALPASNSGSLTLTHTGGVIAPAPPSGIEFFGISSVFSYGNTSVAYQ